MEEGIIDKFKVIAQGNLGTPLLIIVMLLTMILPVPTFMLDMLFTFNITLSLIIITTCIYITRPLDFSIFPTVILIATLLRLTLNIASTRVVLLHGHEGPDAAGQVIHAFGTVLIGGNFTVGIVVFAILVIINFVVVTKGGSRISEVSARFTLDAMPGKQMAIDADLSAGLISQDEAKQRRAEVSQEADFYGAMDGASKFVRGDAVAGILILFINIIGGLAIGIADHGMPFKSALETYALLTVGDGLVAQIPSLLLSTAAAMMVTRVSSKQDMSSQVVRELITNPKPLAISAGVLGLLAIIPGMPHIVFALLSLISGAGAYYLSRQNEIKAFREQLMEANKENQQQQQINEKQQPPEEKELDWKDVSTIDMIRLEIGYRLINLIGAKKDGPLVSRVKGVRKKLSQDLGFLIPTIHIKDNLDLPPTNYRIIVLGVNYGEAEIMVDRLLAINPGQVFGKIEGKITRDPTFNLEAIWIRESQRNEAQSLGYTVVDPGTVIATHLNQILQENAAELLGHEEVQKLLDRLETVAPKLVEALTPAGGISLSTIVKVLKELLRANIPIVDIRSICEAIIAASQRTQNVKEITASVRVALKRMIYQRLFGSEKTADIITLDPGLEQIMLQSAKINDPSEDLSANNLGLEPNLAERVFVELAHTEQQLSTQSKPAVLVVSPILREKLESFTKHSIPGLTVLSYQEIPDDKQINVLAVIGQPTGR
ncbi:MAG: flagellar biosynthesis protein FlhA [Legionellales bacterium]|nr:flagellar biosynthesis protein FlhA [Legionellales bacterium]